MIDCCCVSSGLWLGRLSTPKSWCEASATCSPTSPRWVISPCEAQKGNSYLWKRAQICSRVLPCVSAWQRLCTCQGTFSVTGSAGSQDLCGTAAYTVTQIHDRAFSCSAPHSQLVSSQVTLQVGWNSKLKYGTCCLQIQKGLLSIMPFFHGI